MEVTTARYDEKAVEAAKQAGNIANTTPMAIPSVLAAVGQGVVYALLQIADSIDDLARDVSR